MTVLDWSLEPGTSPINLLYRSLVRTLGHWPPASQLDALMRPADVVHVGQPGGLVIGSSVGIGGLPCE